MDETAAPPIGPTLGALVWAAARGASTESRLIAMTLVAAVEAGRPPPCWTVGGLSVATGLHEAIVGEALRWLRRHRAIRACRLAGSVPAVFPAMDILGQPGDNGPQAPPAPQSQAIHQTSALVAALGAAKRQGGAPVVATLVLAVVAGAPDQRWSTDSLSRAVDLPGRVIADAVAWLVKHGLLATGPGAPDRRLVSIPTPASADNPERFPNA